MRNALSTNDRRSNFQPRGGRVALLTGLFIVACSGSDEQPGESGNSAQPSGVGGTMTGVVPGSGGVGAGVGGTGVGTGGGTIGTGGFGAGGTPTGTGGFGTGGFTSTGGAGTGGSGTGGVGTGGMGTGGSGPPPGDCVPANGVDVDDVLFNQAVGAHLVRDGQWVSPGNREVPLIHGRDALIQSTWSLGGGYSPHEVEARLTIKDNNGNEKVLTSSRTPSGTASLASLDSGAFSFVVPGADLEANGSFQLDYCEKNSSAPGGSGTSYRFPSDGDFAEFEPWPELMSLKVMIVPGSTTCAAAPVFDAAAKKVIEDYIYNLFPISVLEVRYHATMHINNSCGEGDTMAILENMRDNENLGPEWYYQAHFAQAANTSSGGFAWVFENNSANNDRVSWAHNWAGEEPMNTAHELGHNHGSWHTFNNDSDYTPTAGKAKGLRETYGFAITGDHHPWVNGSIYHRIMPPTIDRFGSEINNGNGNDFYDSMSYEQPYWVGAFTYNQWADRIRASVAWDTAGASGPLSKTVKVIIGEGDHLSFRRTDSDLAGSQRSAKLVVGGTEISVAARAVYTCDNDLGFIQFEKPDGMDLDQVDFSIELDGEKLSHHVGDTWY